MCKTLKASLNSSGEKGNYLTDIQSEPWAFWDRGMIWVVFNYFK